MRQTAERKAKKKMKPRKGNSDLKEKNIQRLLSLEWERWFLWSGLSLEATRPVNQIGIYTDFT